MEENERKIEQLTQEVAHLKDTILSLVGMMEDSGFLSKSKCQYTFGEWLLIWQEKYKKKKQNAQTFERNRARIMEEIIPELGGILLRDLTPEDLQDFIDAKGKSNARDKISYIFSGSLRKAHDLGYIAKNPFKALELEKNEPKSYPVLQPRTQLKIIKKLDNPKYLRMFMFYCCTGFRLSEGFSINPKTDIDKKRRVIHLHMTSSKNKNHERDVPYLPELFEGFDLKQSTLFPGMAQSTAQTFFKRFFEKHNIDAVFHSFRHTFISCCYYVGIRDKYIQEWAGHSSVKVTMDTYTHILDYKETPIIAYLKLLKKRLKI